ncbi:MAG: Holliday junction branch migration protein RuvA [Planctomycetota bacterium]
MIARITGKLVDLQADTALIEASPGIVHELLLPAFVTQRLAPSLGQTVMLHTLHFLEGQNQGALFLPRLAGFLTPADKAFYQLLTTVKGIGHRRALRALVLPTDQLASAIADRDIKLLQTMPEVGKKTAETIALTLRDKVDEFLNAPRVSTPGDPDIAVNVSSASATSGGLARGAVEALVTLGEDRARALAWVDQVMQSDERPETIQELIAAVYRLKAA